MIPNTRREAPHPIESDSMDEKLSTTSAMQVNLGELTSQFRAAFGASPQVFEAPGRVNLIGEHTDYNDGFVLPCAINFRTFVAIAPRSDTRLLLRSQSFAEEFSFDINGLPTSRQGAWSDYVIGVVHVLRQRGLLHTGASLLVHGEVPIGAGLSSSAAIEVASALALLSLGEVAVPLPEIAKLCQSAENTFVGARVGIMDQFVSCLGKANHALQLDCRSLKFQFVPIPASVRLVVCDTMVKHALAAGEYNRRREECDEGVRLLQKWYPEIRALRDVSTKQLEQHAADLPPTILRRCQHVVAENNRVLQASSALEAGDLRRFGELMRASHASLRDLYEVSCTELDTMVQVAEGLPGYWGGRMTGGGFGGCTVNLVEAADAQDFMQHVATRYQAQVGVQPNIYICSAVDGAGAAAGKH
jgi:galactokinase